MYRVQLIILLSIIACQAGNEGEKKSLQVTATAYNSLAGQTKIKQPNLAAWGDTLHPGMKAIAVSRDLIDSGLVHNQEVTIEGLEGTFLVKDKMHARWKKKIDIYMGEDVEKARSWGKKKVTISWYPENIQK